MTKYKVLHSGLTYPSDPAIVERLLAGENIPIPQRGLREVVEGDIVDDIPECSLAAMIEKGYVEAVPEPDPPRRTTHSHGHAPQSEEKEVSADDD